MHCGKPADGCRSRVSDRVIANRIVYRFHAPERGDIIVFKAPACVAAACDVSGTFIKRIVGLPGEQVSMKNGQVLVNGVRLHEPYLAPAYRGSASGAWPRTPRTGYFGSAKSGPGRATHAGGASFRARTSSAGRISGTGRRTASATRSVGMSP